MTKILEQLAQIQQELKAPKGQFNSFANFNYRSCEDILNELKPLLNKIDKSLVILIDDEVKKVGERIYVKATALLMSKEGKFKTHGWARESEEKKGMDSSQITGATSSYARKYALNGLLAIDDAKDADTMDNKKTATKPAIAPNPNYASKSPEEKKNEYNKDGGKCSKCSKAISEAERSYSTNILGSAMCRDCQKLNKSK